MPADLRYNTTHKVAGGYLNGILSIQVIDTNTIEGEISAQEECVPIPTVSMTRLSGLLIVIHIIWFALCSLCSFGSAREDYHEGSPHLRA